MPRPARLRRLWVLLAALPAAGVCMDAPGEPVGLNLAPAESAVMSRPPAGILDPALGTTEGELPALVLPDSLSAALQSLPAGTATRVRDNLTIAAWLLLRRHPRIAVLHKPQAPHALLIPDARKLPASAVLGVAVRIPAPEEAAPSDWTESEFRHFAITREDLARWKKIMQSNPLGVEEVARNLRAEDGPLGPPEHAEMIAEDMTTTARLLPDKEGRRWWTRAAEASRIAAEHALQKGRIESFLDAAEKELAYRLAAFQPGQAQKALENHRATIADLQDSTERLQGERMLRRQEFNLYLWVQEQRGASARGTVPDEEQDALKAYDPRPFEERLVTEHAVEVSMTWNGLVTSIAEDVRQAGALNPEDTARRLVEALIENGRLYLTTEQKTSNPRRGRPLTSRSATAWTAQQRLNF